MTDETLKPSNVIAALARVRSGPKPRVTDCTKCAVPMTPENSVPSRRNKMGLSSVCRKCHADAARAWQAKNPEGVRANDHKKYRRAVAAGTWKPTYNPERARQRLLERRYGLTPDDYATILEWQGGGCSICGTAPTNRPLAVDHCHESGRVRGLLCTPCNTALAAMDRDREWPVKADAYLKAADHG